MSEQDKPNPNATTEDAPKPATPNSTNYEISPGKKVGAYIIGEKLGEGGMGEVWRATHSATQEKVAIKVLSVEHINNQRNITRFLRETRAVNELQHRNIVRLLGSGDQLPDGRPYFVMEFLEGKNLSQYLRENAPLPFSQLSAIFAQLCQAVGVAHDHNIVHRDLKPDNVFLLLQNPTTPFVKVLDFGIAKLSGGPVADVTNTGSVFGTPGYMSPEQYGNTKTVDHRTDIYALGVILFEMLTGQNPFKKPGDGLYQVVGRQMSPPPAPSHLVPAKGISRGLDALVQRALAQELESRPQRCSDFYAELVRVLGQDIRSQPTPMGNPVTPIEMADALQKIPPPQETPTIDLISELATPPKPPEATPAVLSIPTPLAPVLSVKKRRNWWVGVAVAVAVAGALAFSSSAPKPAALAPLTPPLPSPSLPVATAPAVTQPKTVSLFVDSTPQGAKVFLNEKLLGLTPLTQDTPRQEAEATLRVEQIGYAPFKQSLSLTQEQRVVAKLEKKKAKDPNCAGGVKTKQGTANPFAKKC